MFRQLLPALLMLSESGEITTTVPLPTSLVTCSRHALKFVQHVTQSFNEQTQVSLKKLIQHVCTKIPERAEYRNKMAMVRDIFQRGTYEYLAGISLIMEPLLVFRAHITDIFSRNQVILFIQIEGTEICGSFILSMFLVFRWSLSCCLCFQMASTLRCWTGSINSLATSR